MKCDPYLDIVCIKRKSVINFQVKLRWFKKKTIFTATQNIYPRFDWKCFDNLYTYCFLIIFIGRGVTINVR